LVAEHERAATIQEASTTVDEVRVAGDWAVSHGVWHMTMSVGGATVGDTTRYVLIWERQEDGSWRIAYDVWNSALPVEQSD
jgi:ketosteroid isomerase-like protein